MANRDPSEFDTSLHGRDPRVGNWGLCRAAYEKDSCGFGLIASLVIAWNMIKMQSVLDRWNTSPYTAVLSELIDARLGRRGRNPLTFSPGDRN